MKNFILIPIGIFLIGSCSNTKDTYLVTDTGGQKNSIEESEFVFEDELIDQIDTIEFSKDLKKEFDINTIEYDTLDLPVLSKNSLIKILTTNQFHANEVWPEAIDQDWIGLFTNGSRSYLKRINPKFERVKDQVLDEDDETTAWKVSTDLEDKCTALITGIDLKEGDVPTINLTKKTLLPLDTIDLRVNGLTTKLLAEGINYRGFIANYKMKLLTVIDGIKQAQTIVAKSNFDDEMINIIWAGDLDGDSKVDLIIDTSRHYNVMAPTLFLSSKSKEGSIVECVAIHETLGC